MLSYGSEAWMYVHDMKPESE